MSYQTSIHFDPTALLIIKNEIDNSITQVEIAVSALIEDQNLPFGIDDALVQLEQCGQVLALINMDNLAKIADYAAELMRKVMANPTETNTQDIEALSEGTNMLRRYIEFICLREVAVPQFLLATLNRLEITLGKPITAEGQHIEKYVGDIIPDFTLNQAPSQEKSEYVHRLYKLALSKLLTLQKSKFDLQAFKVVGAYLSDLAQEHPSRQYWNLVYYVLNSLDHIRIDEPQLRSFIEIESNIRQYFAIPEQFRANVQALTNILSLAVRIEDDVALMIRQQLEIEDSVLTELQLQVLSRHLYGPDINTIHTIKELLNTQMAEIRVDIEFNYQTIEADKIEELRETIQNIANILKVLNLEDTSSDLRQHAEDLQNIKALHDEKFAQELMNALLNAMNAVGLLERKNTSNRLQLGVHNSKIALDRLDEAQMVLLYETKNAIDAVSNLLTEHLNSKDLPSIQDIPARLREIAGALLFINVEVAQTAVKNAADFIESQINQDRQLTEDQINFVFDALASADMLIDNLKNNQPVMQIMFDVALASSEKLKTVA